MVECLNLLSTCSMTGFYYREEIYNIESDFGWLLSSTVPLRGSSYTVWHLLLVLSNTTTQLALPSQNHRFAVSAVETFLTSPLHFYTWQIAKANDIHSLWHSRRKSIPFTTITFLSLVFSYGLPHISMFPFLWKTCVQGESWISQLGLIKSWSAEWDSSLKNNKQERRCRAVPKFGWDESCAGGSSCCPVEVTNQHTLMEKKKHTFLNSQLMF